MSLPIKLFIYLLLFANSVFAEEWQKHIMSLNTHNEKIKNNEKSILALIEEKKSTKDQARIKLILVEMQILQKEIEQSSQKLSEEVAHMRFDHPEKGQQEKEDLKLHQVKSIDELESSTGIEGKLSSLVEKIRKIYSSAGSAKVEVAKPIEPEKPKAKFEKIIIRE